jgi:hypothetical protein
MPLVSNLREALTCSLPELFPISVYNVDPETARILTGLSQNMIG